MSEEQAVCAALLARLRGAGLRAYDEIPSNRSYPYVAIGPVQVVPEDGGDTGCELGCEVTVDLNAWSQSLAFAEVAAVSKQVRSALAADLQPVGYRVLIQHVDGAELTKDPEAERTRGRLTLRLELEPV